VAWRDLGPEHRAWVVEGDPDWVSWEKSWPGKWYGVKRFFKWLESKSYKMHIRVLLSKYRAYTPCEACAGSRLKPDALLWRVGRKVDADRVLDPARRFHPRQAQWSDATLAALPGLTLHDLLLLPIAKTRDFFADFAIAGSGAADEATALVLEEVRARLGYLCAVGLSYLTLDRQ